MKTINLLPKDEQHQLKLDVLNRQLRVFWGIILAFAVLFVGLGIGTQQYLRLKSRAADRP
jgi:hypothetical protein